MNRLKINRKTEEPEIRLTSEHVAIMVEKAMQGRDSIIKEQGALIKKHHKILQALNHHISLFVAGGSSSTKNRLQELAELLNHALQDLPGIEFRTTEDASYPFAMPEWAINVMDRLSQSNVHSVPTLPIQAEEESDDIIENAIEGYEDYEYPEE